MKTRKLTFYTDPGHGWLAVNRTDLDALDIAHKITRCSYERANRVYLEEDLDAETYMTAAKAAGWRVTIREQYQDPSPVRDFASYQPRVTPAALINAAQRLGKLYLLNVK